MKKPADTKQENIDKNRREFLKNSVYAAYATPIITALLVAEESAAASRPNCPQKCDQYPDDPGCHDCP